MDKELLVTLVKLASAGTSGVCILAIFWSGWLLLRTANRADGELYHTLRHFMAFALGIAVVSAFAASISSYFNYRQIVELKARSVSLTQANETLNRHVEESEVKLAGLARQHSQFVALTRQLTDKVARATATSPALAGDLMITLEALRKVETRG